MPERTLEELTRADQGFILIHGPRYGKTYLCDEFLRRWEERRLSYRFFSPNRPNRTAGSARWGSSFGVSSDKLVGYRVALIDEHSKFLRRHYIEGLSLLVIATSEPLPWMTTSANWLIKFSAPRQYWIDQGVPLPGPPPPPPTPRLSLWERLSTDDWCI
jgi:hypothetical protein